MILERGIIPPIAELGSLNKTIDAEFLKLEVRFDPYEDAVRG